MKNQSLRLTHHQPDLTEAQIVLINGKFLDMLYRAVCEHFLHPLSLKYDLLELYLSLFDPAEKFIVLAHRAVHQSQTYLALFQPFRQLKQE
jgi:hypothetical protein